MPQLQADSLYSVYKQREVAEIPGLLRCARNDGSGIVYDAPSVIASAAKQSRNRNS
ncbi:MAG: hypothetical protein WCG04_01450 [Alphaproteobacteria bacterium]